MRFVLLISVALAVTVQAESPKELLAKREDPSVAKVLEALIERARSEPPKDVETLLLASAFLYWKADDASDKQLKKQWAKEGWSLAEKALALAPNRMEAHYLAAINIGAYAQAVGIWNALTEGLEGQFNRRLDRALAMNANFDHGGPCTAKGRYHFELPWPKRDLRKSKQVLEECIAKNPEALRARVYLAETLHADGEKEKAKELLAKVLSSSVEYAPPEGRRAQAWAKKLQVAWR